MEAADSELQDRRCFIFVEAAFVEYGITDQPVGGGTALARNVGLITNAGGTEQTVRLIDFEYVHDAHVVARYTRLQADATQRVEVGVLPCGFNIPRRWAHC